MTGSILVVAYTVVLHHIYNGSRSKWLYMIVGLLLVSSFCYLGQGVATHEVFVKQHFTVLSISLVYVFWGTYLLSFNVSHYMLAVRYQSISKKVPAKLEGKPDPKRTKCDAAVEMTLYILNATTGYLFALGSCINQVRAYVLAE